MNRIIPIICFLSLLAITYAGFEIHESIDSPEIYWMDMPVDKSIIDIVDNRDYEDDAFEVYLFNHHVGQYYVEHKEFVYSLTGKTK